MVYQGKPSRGCGVCRKRRIKCDEAVPSCSYCVKRQIPCPGYKSQFDIAWRDQNSTAEKSVQRRKNASIKTDQEQCVVLQKSAPISVTIPQDYGGYAADFFFSSYILLPQDGQVQRGFFDCLFPVWQRAPQDSPLRPAVTAVASCLLMAWSQFRAEDAVLSSHSHYLKGVASVRQSLLMSDEMRDDVLMATMILDMYENVQAFISRKPNKSPHIAGLKGMLEYRSRKPQTSRSSKSVLLGARSHLIGKALGSSVPVSSSIAKLDDEVGDVPKTAGLRLEDLLAEIAAIQASVLEFDSGLCAEDVDMLNTLETALELDMRLLAWEASVPVGWEVAAVSGAECIPDSVRQAGLYQDYCCVYQSLFIANTFNTYYVARIRLQQSIVMCLKHLDPATMNMNVMAAMETIQNLADSICASVPFHLGNRSGIGRIDDKTVQYPHIPGQPPQQGHHLAAAAFGGFLLALRLGELMSLPVQMRSGQRQWIGGQLYRITTIYSNHA